MYQSALEHRTLLKSYLEAINFSYFLDKLDAYQSRANHN